MVHVGSTHSCHLLLPAVMRGDRIAQLVLERIHTPSVEEVTVRLCVCVCVCDVSVVCRICQRLKEGLEGLAPLELTDISYNLCIILIFHRLDSSLLIILL